MSGDGDVRIGLLGTGAIAQVVHLPVLTQLAGVRVEAVCDADRSKAAAIASRFGIPRVYRRDEEVFRADDLDAVIVCTPSHMHEEQAMAALESGKHVLVEKPLALDSAGAARVVQVAERAGRTLMVAMNTRYRPDAVAVKPFIQGGELGTVFLVKSAWMNRRVRTVRPTWRHRRATAGGGALMDLGVQVLDLCLWLLDYPAAARVVAQAHPGEGMEVEDSGIMLLQLRTGAAISVAASWSLVANRDRHYLRLLATRGSASLAPFAVYKEVEHGVLDVTPQLPAGNENLYMESYRRQLGHFVDCARGSAVADLPREQIELMRLVALAYRSVAEGREVEA